jgi:hypothetical protein
MKKTIAYRSRRLDPGPEPEGGAVFWKAYYKKIFGVMPRENSWGRIYLRNNLFVIEEKGGRG